MSPFFVLGEFEERRDDYHTSFASVLVLCAVN